MWEPLWRRLACVLRRVPRRAPLSRRVAASRASVILIARRTLRKQLIPFDELYVWEMKHVCELAVYAGSLAHHGYICSQRTLIGVFLGDRLMYTKIENPCYDPLFSLQSPQLDTQKIQTHQYSEPSLGRPGRGLLLIREILRDYTIRTIIPNISA